MRDIGALRLRQTNTNMTHNDRTIAKDLKVLLDDSHVCQGKNRELVRQRLRMLTIYLFSNDSHINVTETRLLLIFWKDSLNGSSLMTNWGFY